MIVKFLFVFLFVSSCRCHLKDDAKKWFEFVSNPSSRCSPNANAEKNKLVLKIYERGLLDFQMGGDCSFKEGYSLNYKVESVGKLKKGPLSGTGSISFNSISNHGFRTGVCLRSLSNDVMRIDGTFEQNLLQGHFTVYFKDDTTMDGFAKDSQIISPVRYFVRNKLANITGNHNNWIERFGYHTFQSDKLSEYFFKLNEEESGIICEESLSSNPIFDNCQDSKLSFEAESCHFQIKPLQPTSKMFRWNRQNDERHYEGDDEYSNCSDGWIEGAEASAKLGSWFESLNSLSPDPYWRLTPYPDAVDESNSRISFSVSEWKRSNLNIELNLKTFNGVIDTKIIENGRLEFEIDASNIPELRSNYVFMASKLSYDSSTFKIDFESEEEDSKTDELLNSKLLVVGHLKKGKYHGIVRRFGQVVSDPQTNCTKNVFSGLSFVGRYERGVPQGPSWRVVPGGGLLYGDISGDEFTGKDLAYVYPDYETAIVGRFEKGILMEGREARLTGVRCMNGVYEAKFSEPQGPSYAYGPPSNSSFGGRSPVTDPLDKKYVYVKDSSLGTEGANEGVFAGRDIKAGTLFALYCGYILNSEDHGRFDERSIKENKEKGVSEDSDEYYAYMKYHMSLKKCGLTITCPAELGNTYKATLGHKFQHSFNPNTMFSTILDTPRFGVCMTFQALRDLKKDEELFVNYGYSEKSTIPWFRKLYKETYKKSSSSS